MTARIGWAAPSASGGSDEGGTTGGSSVITDYEIRRGRGAEIRRREGWRLDEARDILAVSGTRC